MIECIFTLDYEIYGNGEGSLRELVLEPAQVLKGIFDEAGAKLVVFVEAAELLKIEAAGTDPAIEDVKRQVREFHLAGHEIALHLHPQWFNAERKNGTWELDYEEYNLCTLAPGRIAQLVERAIGYLRTLVHSPDFIPLSFRAGNWLFQPTREAAKVLAEQGVKLDSSVFKGGHQHKHRLDYRRAAKNGHYWRFQDDVNIPDPNGSLLEVPIYTRMVPFWKMATKKRLSLQHKGASRPRQARARFYRLLDLARFRHPLKFDFCRMTLDELAGMVEPAIQEDRQSPRIFKPLVSIGHTKDLVDSETIRAFLAFLSRRSVPVSTLEQACSKCQPA